MPKKDNLKKLFESTSIESADAHPEQKESNESEQGAADSPASASIPDRDASGSEAESTGEQGIQAEAAEVEETEPVSADPRSEPDPLVPSPDEEDVEIPGVAEASSSADNTEKAASDDILDDVRRSLIEEETDKTQKQSRWWRRLGRKGNQPDPAEAPVPAEIDLPELDNLPGSVEEPASQQEEAEQDVEEIEDLIQMLEVESREGESEPIAAPMVAAAPEPEPDIDFEELKRQAFQPRADDVEDQRISDVRSVALEGGEEVLVEVEAKPVDAVEERLQAFENALKPYRRYIYYVLALLGVGMAVVAALILFNVYRQSRPEPVQEVASNLPYPVAVSLPGGWSFQLGRGTVQNGEWNPGGAEWLEGTEVCRWVSLPWSTQLEAVLRTLNPDDPIELVMSNNDRLIYEVYSVRELSPEEMQQLDSNSPCLLVILTGSESEERWVLTALP